MLGNSLAGAFELFGETVEAQVIVDETYSTATGTIARQLEGVTWKSCQKRNVTSMDRKRVSLVKEASQILLVPAGQVTEDSVPVPRMKITIDGALYEILSVTVRSLRSVPVSYLCQLAGR